MWFIFDDKTHAINIDQIEFLEQVPRYDWTEKKILRLHMRSGKTVDVLGEIEEFIEKTGIEIRRKNPLPLSEMKKYLNLDEYSYRNKNPLPSSELDEQDEYSYCICKFNDPNSFYMEDGSFKYFNNAYYPDFARESFNTLIKLVAIGVCINIRKQYPNIGLHLCAYNKTTLDFGIVESYPSDEKIEMPKEWQDQMLMHLQSRKEEV